MHTTLPVNPTSLTAMTENVHERLTKITEGFGPDVVIEAVGSPATYVMELMVW